MRKVIRDMTGVAGLRRYKNIFVSIWGRDLTFKDHIKRFFKKTKGFLITNFLIFGILIISGNGWLYLILWWAPLLTFFSFFYRVRSITEHSGVLGDDDFKALKNFENEINCKMFIRKIFESSFNSNSYS